MESSHCAVGLCRAEPSSPERDGEQDGSDDHDAQILGEAAREIARACCTRQTKLKLVSTF